MKEGASRIFGIALFVVMGASALVLGVMNMGQSISGPLKLNFAANPLTSAADQQLASLKIKDTDGDSLSDYDELYAYRTSPYIKDSDSDGIDDSAEIKNETDPNCPQGKDCGTPAPVNSGSSLDLLNISPTDLFGTGSDADTVLSPLPGTTGNILEATSGNVGQIRQMLKEQGLSDDILSTIDDATLIQMYNEAIVTAQKSADSNSNVNANQ
jgi:hypothetical protein